MASLMAEFASPEQLLAALRFLRKSGETRLNAYTPYPIPELNEVLSIPPSWVAKPNLLHARFDPEGKLVFFAPRPPPLNTIFIGYRTLYGLKLRVPAEYAIRETVNPRTAIAHLSAKGQEARQLHEKLAPRCKLACSLRAATLLTFVLSPFSLATCSSRFEFWEQSQCVCPLHTLDIDLA